VFRLALALSVALVCTACRAGDGLSAALPVVLPHYCERDVFGSEPLTTVSNASFGIGAWVGWRRWRATPTRLVRFLTTWLVVVGAGSALWHWYHVPALLPLDTAPLYVLVLVIAYSALSAMRTPRYAIAAVAGVVIGAIAANALTVGTPLHVASRHGAVIIGLSVALVPARVRNPRAWAWMMAALFAYASGLVAKALDAPLCPSIPVGTHWLWHTFGGAAAALGVQGVWLARSR
jgi:hypothetical protein